MRFKRESPHSSPGLMWLIVSSTMPHLICDKDSFTQGLMVEWKNGATPSLLHPSSSSHILPIVPTSFPAPVHLGVSRDRDRSSGLGWVRLSDSPALLLLRRLLLEIPAVSHSCSTVIQVWVCLNFFQINSWVLLHK